MAFYPTVAMLHYMAVIYGILSTCRNVELFGCDIYGILPTWRVFLCSFVFPLFHKVTAMHFSISL